MRVALRELKPNPLRDFKVDPMDPEAIERLKASIQEDGFWGGVVCRRVADGSIETGAGHHRVAAAIAAGIEEADLFVGDFDDDDMVIVYARENATQRSDTGVSQVGSVASALRRVAGKSLRGVLSELGQHSQDIIGGNIASDKGIGWKTVLAFLDKVPGVCKKTVDQSLANLKSSGHYARIMEEVQAEIERERREAEEAAEVAEAERISAEEEAAKAAAEEAEAKAAKARKAAEKAAKAKAAKAAKAAAAEKAAKAAAKAAERPKTFDFDGVSKHLKVAHQVDVFRDVVTGAGILPYLPVENQAALAEHLVALAKKRDAELSGAFIRDNAITAVLDVKRFERKLSKEDQESLIANDLAKRAKAYQHDFAGGIRTALAYGTRLSELRQKFIDAGVPFPITDEFRRVLDESAARFAELKKLL